MIPEGGIFIKIIEFVASCGTDNWSSWLLENINSILGRQCFLQCLHVHLFIVSLKKETALSLPQ